MAKLINGDAIEFMKTLEEAIKGHARFSSMSKEELMKYKYIG